MFLSTVNHLTCLINLCLDNLITFTDFSFGFPPPRYFSFDFIECQLYCVQEVVSFFLNLKLIFYSLPFFLQCVNACGLP